VISREFVTRCLKELNRHQPFLLTTQGFLHLICLHLISLLQTFLLAILETTSAAQEVLAMLMFRHNHL
jgi:hypothetical protein